MQKRSCMKKSVKKLKNAKIFSSTKELPTKISSWWLWNRHRKWSRVCLWLPSNLQLRGWKMFHSWQPEGLQVRSLPEEREQQWQISTVWHLLWMVPYQGRRLIPEFFLSMSSDYGLEVCLGLGGSVFWRLVIKAELESFLPDFEGGDGSETKDKKRNFSQFFRFFIVFCLFMF